MAFGKKRSDMNCGPACMTLKWVVCALLVIAAIAAAIGVYQTHILAGAGAIRIQFGSTSGSLAIVAFTLSSYAAMKQMIRCLGPCEICDA